MSESGSIPVFGETWLNFSVTDCGRCVRAVLCAEVAAAVAMRIPGWPRQRADAPDSPEIAAEVVAAGYRVRAANEVAGVVHADAEAAATAVVDRLVAHWLRAHPGGFCLHAAGYLTAAGEAVLLYGFGGSGKSTMAALLAASGRCIVGDDIALVRPDDRGGPVVAAAGTAVKLRRPLPAAVAARIADFVAARQAQVSEAAIHLHPGPDEMLAFGRAAPVSACIELVRGAVPAGADLQPRRQAEAVRSMHPCVYAPELTANERLRALTALTRAVPAYRLKAADSCQAADLLLARFP